GSFVEQPLRKRQSSQVTKTLPDLSTSADGRGLLRIPPGSVAAVIDVIVRAAPQLAPPSVEIDTPSAVSFALSIGMIAVPFGWKTGWPPLTPTFGVLACVHVSPPSRENAARNSLPWPRSSHW